MVVTLAMYTSPKRLVAEALMVACVLTGCSSPPEVATVPVVSVGPKGTAPPSLPAGPLEVMGADVKQVALDGDLGDWADLPVNVLSYGVSAKGLFFSGKLDPQYAGGIFLTVGTKVPEVPMIGDWTRGGGTDPPNCDFEREYYSGEWVVTERALPPETAEACLASVRAYDKLRDEHAARFHRSYRIDASGVKIQTEAGGWEAVPDAKAFWKGNADEGFAFEVGLPLSAMPRLSEAPLLGLYVLPGRTDGGAKPITPPSQIVPLMATSSPSHFTGELPKAEVELPIALLPEPVSFEPFGDLRANVFENLSVPRPVGDYFFSTAGISYLASDPLHVETMQGGQWSASASVEPLYEKELVLGDVEVGRVRAYFSSFAIFLKGKLVDRIEPIGDEKKVLRRGDEIHIISYKSSGYTMHFGPQPAAWSVIAIGPDGTHREAVDGTMEMALQEVGCAYAGPTSFDSDTPSSTESFDKLGWKGSCQAGTYDKLKEQGFEVSYRWDADQKHYLGTFRKIPVPKKPVPKRLPPKPKSAKSIAK